MILIHKAPPKDVLKPLSYDQPTSISPSVEEEKKPEGVVPLLDRVEESDVDRSALNQLLMLGYDKEMSLIALRKVGTQYGSLGYDGLNKAIDYIQRRRAEEAEKLLKVSEEPKNTNEDEAEKERKRKEAYMEMQRRASSEAKKRYHHLQNQMGKADANISLSSQDLTN